MEIAIAHRSVPRPRDRTRSGRREDPIPTEMTMTTRLLIVVVAIVLPYLARIPGGARWLEQYTSAGLGGLLFITACDAVALGWMLAWTLAIRRRRWWTLPCGAGFACLAWAHGGLDLAADAQAAIALVFIPFLALVPITVGGVVGLAFDRLTGAAAEDRHRGG